MPPGPRRELRGLLYLRQTKMEGGLYWRWASIRGNTVCWCTIICHCIMQLNGLVKTSSLSDYLTRLHGGPEYHNATSIFMVSHYPSRWGHIIKSHAYIHKRRTLIQILPARMCSLESCSGLLMHTLKKKTLDQGIFFYMIQRKNKMLFWVYRWYTLTKNHNFFVRMYVHKNGMAQ